MKITGRELRLKSIFSAEHRGSRAKRTRASLRNATIEGANFTDAVFNQTIIPDGTKRNR